jgi:hypothetical protein
LQYLYLLMELVTNMFPYSNDELEFLNKNKA